MPHPRGQTGRPVLSLSVPKLVSTIFWKRMYRFWRKWSKWHKWSTGKGHETTDFGGQEVKGQGHNRFGGLGEASLSTPLCRVGLLVHVIRTQALKTCTKYEHGVYMVVSISLWLCFPNSSILPCRGVVSGGMCRFGTF